MTEPAPRQAWWREVLWRVWISLGTGMALGFLGFQIGIVLGLVVGGVLAAARYPLDVFIWGPFWGVVCGVPGGAVCGLITGAFYPRWVERLQTRFSNLIQPPRK